MSELVLYIIDWIYFVFLFMAGLLSISRYGKYDKTLNILPIYLILSFLIDFWATYLTNNISQFQRVYIFFGPIEFFFISNVYFRFTTKTKPRKFILLLQLLYTLTVMISYFGFKITNHYYVYNLRGVLIIGLNLIYFRKLYSSQDIVNLKEESLFWFSIGNLFFWTGVFFVVALITPINKTDPEIGKVLYLINPLLNIFLFSMFIKSFLCNKIPLQ